ncbi:phosphate ABC transporter substrate-binding protein PstS [Parenemella sanctibonifatiensis]|uniref:Phosphate-binding protein n=2 Tax=Parenemella sanctibonifatiensis TaxID=2016505 RepID=A0A255EM13_9ACTN|nr:phosphate ABC transporter substrate-binding protein PstS [Parenemella sanctibonifatiensis]
MSMNRFAKIAAVAAASTLVLAACSSESADPTQPASSGPATSSSSSSASTETGGGTGFTPECPGGQLTGSGASSQVTAVTEVISAYSAECGDTQIEYTGPGSGDGIKAFVANQVDWAGSDSVLKDDQTTQAAERCGGNDAWNLPMVVGPIAFAFNIDGVDELNLTAPVVSKILLGEITSWNDPAIAELNPDATLPDQAISVFFRSSSSGTTENLTKYLAEAGEWPHEPSKDWAGSVGEGRPATADVADSVANTPGGFSYMEWGAALERNLGVASLDGAELNPENVGSALTAAENVGEGNDIRLELKYSGLPEGAYPAIMVTYEIVCSAGGPENTELLKDFLGYWASEDGQAPLEDLGYSPLPAEMIAQVEEAIAAIEA